MTSPHLLLAAGAGSWLLTVTTDGSAELSPRQLVRR